MNTFRNWCQLNAPIVDFASKVIISILGLILAFFAMQLTRTQVAIQQGQLEIQQGQLKIQQRQLQIQERQLEAQRQAHLPKFRLRIDRPTAEERSSLVVDNDGGHVFDFVSDVVAFWRVYEHDRQTDKRVASAKIAAQPFFVFGKNPMVRWSPPTGELARYYIFYLEDWKQSTSTLDRLPTPSTWLVGDDYELILRFRYKDVFGAKHEQFYAIIVDARDYGYASSPTQFLTSGDGNHIFKMYEEQILERRKLKFDPQEAWNKHRKPAE